MNNKNLNELYVRFENLVKEHKISLMARGFSKSKVYDWQYRLSKNQKIGLKIVIPVMSKMDNVQYIILANNEDIKEVFIKELSYIDKHNFLNTLKEKKKGKATKGTSYTLEFMIKNLQEKGFEISLKKEKIADTQTQLTE